MVDVAWPDAIPARQFGWAVDRWIGSDFENRAELAMARSTLETWQANHAAVESTLRSTPGLAEMLPMSENLRNAATIGLEALEVTSQGTTKDQGWLEARLESLQGTAQSVGQTELMIVDPLVRLVCAAAGPAGDAATGCQQDEEVQRPAAH